MGHFKGIGPNKLGASKSMAKNQNKGYGTVANKGYDTMAKQTAGQKATFGPGGTDENPKLYAGIVKAASKQTRSEIKADKLASKAEKAVKDDKMNKNSRLVDRYNNLVDRKGLNKEKIAKG